MKKTPLSELKKFLGTVFHPNWTIEQESADHAIKKWLRKADDKAKKGVLHDINDLLGQESDEALENWVCEEAKGDIFPPALGFTYASWLRHVGEMIAGPQKKAAKKKTA
jgi:CdiI immunity protein